MSPAGTGAGAEALPGEAAAPAVGAGAAARDPGRAGKSDGAFRTISEVAEELDVAQHVLRFWESKFPQVRPLKRGGGRRYYRPEDVGALRRIRALLYDEGYTIRGAQQLLRPRRAAAAAARAAEPPPVPAPSPPPGPAPGPATTAGAAESGGPGLRRLRAELAELRGVLAAALAGGDGG